MYATETVKLTLKIVYNNINKKTLGMGPRSQYINHQTKGIHMNTSLSQSISLDNINIRSAVHEGVRYYSVVDCVRYLVDESEDARNYWKVLKFRANKLVTKCNQLKEENKKIGMQLHGKIVQLQLKAEDGKLRDADCATQENIFYIMQYIPSNNADRFKEQFAKIVNERIEEEKNPALAIDRIVRVYKNRGMTDDWIQKRFKAIVARNNLTDTLKEHGIKAYEYAKTTNILYKHSVGMDADEYKEYKGLEKKDRLRDNFSVEELELSDMTERFLKAQIKKNDSQGFDEIKEDAKVAGDYGARIREIMEEALGKSIINKKQDLIEEDK